jgi:hypothetical protein
MVDVNPGDTVRVGFTLTNTGSPVGGSGTDRFYMPTMFINDSRTDLFSGDLFSGGMTTNQSKNFSVNIPVPANITVDSYNLEIDVIYEGTGETIASVVVQDQVNITGVYSVSISNISVTKV